MDDGVTDIKDLVSSDSPKEQEEEGSETEGGKGEKEEEGFITHLISNLVSPRGGVKEQDSSFTSADEEGKGGGGILNNLISGILHQTQTEGGGGAADDEAAGKEGGSANNNIGGGWMDNLVSHLPSPLSDDAAPEAEEASILIHSIVHD